MDIKKKALPNERLRKARAQRNLTQSELAAKLGVIPVTISRWENGISTPTPYWRQKLCGFFQLDSEALGLITPEENIVPSQNTLPDIWNVPYRHNPFFTGRESILKRIHAMRNSGKATALTQSHAITGLGGIGKTQVAIEYIYRHFREYIAILWIRADSRQLIISDFITIAHLLNLKEKDEQDQTLIVTAVKRWLREHKDWLLIFDNADNVDIISDFVDSLGGGHVLLTTRQQHIGTIAQCIEVRKLEPGEGAKFLLRRAGIVSFDTPFENISTVDYNHVREIAKILDGLPLALDQAGAYIQETACGLEGYLKRYRERHIQLLNIRDPAYVPDHPDSVAVTLSLSIARVEEANLAAADLLRLCAFLHPDAIPEEIIMEGASELGSTLETTADQIKLDFAIGDLRRFSLLERDPGTRTLIVHRLVQEVLKNSMDKESQCLWAERAVKIVNLAFPDVNLTNLKACQRYIQQAQTCADLIKQYDIVRPEAIRLLHQAATYLQDRTLYTQAEQLFVHAQTLQERVLGPEHSDTIQSLEDLGRLYLYQHKYAQAELLYQKTLAVRQRLLGPEHPEIARSLGKFAALYYYQGRYIQAEVYWQRALAILEQELGLEDPQLLVCLNGLANIYVKQGKFSQAESIYQQIQTIHEKTLAPEDPHVSMILDRIAQLYHIQGKYAQAETLFQRAIAIREKAFGPMDLAVAASLYGLAGLYMDQGKYAQAKVLLERGLFISERTVGLGDPNAAFFLNGMAKLYYLQGNYEEAEPLLVQALNIRETVLGSEHSDTSISLNDMAALCQARNEYDKAELFYRRALVIRENTLGPESPDTATTLSGLASLYQAQGYYDKAETIYQRVLTIYENIFGSEHSNTVAIRKNYNTLLREAKREEASGLKVHEFLQGDKDSSNR